MSKLPLHTYQAFEDLRLDEFDKLSFSVYILDRSWNYIFVNQFVTSNLGSDTGKLEGLNLWERFPQLKADPVFAMLKRNSENELETDIITVSPLTGQRLNIVGKPMRDCFLFYATVLPNKDDLLRELRDVLKKRD
jgi:hypothetical protein